MTCWNSWLLVFIHQKICKADALKMPLEAKKVVANVYVAMRYWHPFTEEVVQ
ncbi:putative protoporphyrin ferrochelatase [Helianthus annuus]|uniref:Protoporphyrin ferrochelatase n=1 Tax=Helianthus annuus TaxID=4232 RepID=A0A9K3ISW6_HELAN|nr:putative protoporphyrin ferrochelatase [Helianthus annuus]KAJ0740775.1 putative protoporphyrin ferrochelatase [Helianthus annuus]KAJ0915415.1 putative protoporphyrin ferrochelatase [Helianthus annuus]